MIKLIVSDVDGTLAEDGGSINPELFDVILKLKEQGIYFVAASGRHQVRLEHAFEPIKDRIFFISANGCYVGTSKRELFLRGQTINLIYVIDISITLEIKIIVK